jgi:hypothetical protein
LWRFLQISFFILIVSSTTFGQINHDLKVTLYPDSHRLEIVDKITLPDVSTKTEPLLFILYQGLKPEVLDKDIILKKNFGAGLFQIGGHHTYLIDLGFRKKSLIILIMVIGNFQQQLQEP